MSWQPPLTPKAPTRRLRAAGPWLWGVDPSTERCSIGVALSGTDDPARVHTVSFPALEGPQRLSVITGDVFEFVKGMAHTYPPGLVVVEQPSGSKQAVNFPLIYAVAATMIGLYDGCVHDGQQAPRFETVQSGKWKKDLLGYGAIRKPSRAEVKAGVQYAVLDWARETQGYGRSSWDEADALAIACWARQDVLLEVPGATGA